MWNQCQTTSRPSRDLSKQITYLTSILSQSPSIVYNSLTCYSRHTTHFVKDEKSSTQTLEPVFLMSTNIATALDGISAHLLYIMSLSSWKTYQGSWFKHTFWYPPFCPRQTSIARVRQIHKSGPVFRIRTIFVRFLFFKLFLSYSKDIYVPI